MSDNKTQSTPKTETPKTDAPRRASPRRFAPLPFDPMQVWTIGQQAWQQTQQAWAASHEMFQKMIGDAFGGFGSSSSSSSRPPRRRWPRARTTRSTRGRSSRTTRSLRHAAGGAGSQDRHRDRAQRRPGPRGDRERERPDGIFAGGRGSVDPRGRRPPRPPGPAPGAPPARLSVGLRRSPRRHATSSSSKAARGSITFVRPRPEGSRSYSCRHDQSLVRARSRPGASLVEALVGAGFDVWCLDWGVPEDEDRYLDWGGGHRAPRTRGAARAA